MRVPGPQRPFTGLPSRPFGWLLATPVPHLPGPLTWSAVGIVRGAGRRSVGMVVPAVGVVIGHDHRGILPLRLLLQEVDQVDVAYLFVERVGIAGMTVLKSRRLDVGDGREIAGLHRRVEILEIVLVVGRIDGLAVRLQGMADRLTSSSAAHGSGWPSTCSTGTRRGAGCSPLWCRPRLLEKVLRAQPVVPLELVSARLKPPMKPPQLICAALSRSPMFLPDIKTVLVVLEHCVEGRVGVADQRQAALAVGDR